MSKKPSTKGKRPAAQNFTAQQLNQLRENFNHIDADGNGVLDEDELRTFLRENQMDPDFVKLMIFMFDKNRKGTLTFNEFVEYIDSTKYLDTNPKQFYKIIFDKIDVKKRGSITATEFKNFCDLVGNPISEQDAKDTIKSLDRRKINALVFDDLYNWISTNLTQ